VPGKLASSVGIKRSVVVDFLSVALVVYSQPIGCKRSADKSMRRVDCGRGRCSVGRTGRNLRGDYTPAMEYLQIDRQL